MLFNIFDVLRFSEALQRFFFKFLDGGLYHIETSPWTGYYMITASFMKKLKWGKNEEKCWEQHILWSSKILFCFWIEAYIFFSNGHIRNVVSTLPNIVKIDVENGNDISTLSNVVQFNVEKHNVVSTLLFVVNFNIDIHNVVLTLIWRCATSRRHINLKTTLNRRWNVCWEDADIIEQLILV